MIRTFLWLLLALFIIGAASFLIWFPGRQTPIAFTLATGMGIKGLQQRVEDLESKAIKGEELSESERKFLWNLYTCFAKGGSVVAPESGKMMRRYLSGTGEALSVEPGLFIGSAPVRNEMAKMKKELLTDPGSAGTNVHSSETFYMADPSYFDSLVGLYYGRLRVRVKEARPDALVLAWRAEVPWKWPSYEETLKQHGDYHGHAFPLPNARSVLFGREYCLRIDDGLGGHLATIGLAKPFLVFAEWEETIERGRGN